MLLELKGIVGTSTEGFIFKGLKSPAKDMSTALIWIIAVCCRVNIKVVLYGHQRQNQ